MDRANRRPTAVAKVLIGALAGTPVIIVASSHSRTPDQRCPSAKRTVGEDGGRASHVTCWGRSLRGLEGGRRCVSRRRISDARWLRGVSIDARSALFEAWRWLSVAAGGDSIRVAAAASVASASNGRRLDACAEQHRCASNGQQPTPFRVWQGHRLRSNCSFRGGGLDLIVP